jgi:hypothetical protein
MRTKAAAHQTSPTACVRKSEPLVREFTQEVRRFATTCTELLALRDWPRTRLGAVFCAGCHGVSLRFRAARVSRIILRSPDFLFPHTDYGLARRAAVATDGCGRPLRRRLCTFLPLRSRTIPQPKRDPISNSVVKGLRRCTVCSDCSASRK